MLFQVRNETALKTWIAVTYLKIDSELPYEAVNSISDFSNDTSGIARRKEKECFHLPTCPVHK